MGQKTIKIDSFEKVAYGAIGVSLNKNNEVYFVVDPNITMLDGLYKNIGINFCYDHFNSSKIKCINTPVRGDQCYVHSTKDSVNQPGLVINYRDLNDKQKMYLLMLTKKGELGEVFKDLEVVDIDFLSARSIVNEKNPEPEFVYRLVVYDAELEEHVTMLAFVNSNGVITKIHKRLGGHIYYLEDCNRYEYMKTREGDNSCDYYDSFGNLQLENIQIEMLITKIELVDIIYSGKYQIYSSETKDGTKIAYMIKEETGELVTYLNPEIDCVQIFNEFLFKFGKGEKTPYIRQQKR